MNNTQQLLDAVGPGAAAELTKEVQLAEIMRLADDYRTEPGVNYEGGPGYRDVMTRRGYVESAVRKALGL